MAFHTSPPAMDRAAYFLPSETTAFGSGAGWFVKAKMPSCFPRLPAA